MNICAWTASATPAPTSTSTPVVISGYTSKGCYADAQTRVLVGYSYASATMTIQNCLNSCKTRGFSIAGVEK
jgi:hypothetical protein